MPRKTTKTETPPAKATKPRAVKAVKAKSEKKGTPAPKTPPVPAKPARGVRSAPAVSGVSDAAPASAPASNLEPKPAAMPTEDQIRLRAYEIWLERGGQHGSPESDWLAAERQLLAR